MVLGGRGDFRPRARRVVAPTVAAVVAAILVAVLGLDREWMPAWLADLPRAVPPVAAAAITALAAAAIQQWAARRNAEADTERAAVAELQKHLGRQLVMPRIGHKGAGGLALRVHRAIPLDAAASGPGPVYGGASMELPLFVERDLSAEIRTWMRQARDTGGFLLLVGDSSVGKTRLLYESAAAELGDFGGCQMVCVRGRSYRRDHDDRCDQWDWREEGLQEGRGCASG